MQPSLLWMCRYKIWRKRGSLCERYGLVYRGGTVAGWRWPVKSWRCRWFTADEREGCRQRCKLGGRAGRAGRRLRPLFNRSTAAQRPVVIPSWRATPVSLLWPRVSCSLAVSPKLYISPLGAVHLATSRVTRRHIRSSDDYSVIASKQ